MCLTLFWSFIGRMQSNCLLIVCFYRVAELGVITHSFLFIVSIFVAGYPYTFNVRSSFIVCVYSLIAGISSRILYLRIWSTFCLISSENPFSIFQTSNYFNLVVSLSVWYTYLSTSKLLSSTLLIMERVSILLMQASLTLAMQDFSAFSNDKQIFFFNSTKLLVIFYFSQFLVVSIDAMHVWICVGVDKSRSLAYNILAINYG